MAIGAIGSVSQGMKYDQTANRDEAKIEKYEQTLSQLKQNLKRTEKDAELSDDEKMQKTQEIQTEIEDINRQKRLAELEKEQKKEDLQQKQQEKSQNPAQIAKEDPQGTTTANQKMERRQERESEEDPKNLLLSAEQMESVVIRDDAVRQANKQRSTAQDLENRIRVLGGEIQIDQSRGVDTTTKQAEQDDLQRRVNQTRENAGKRLGNEQRRAEEKRNEEEQKKTNYRFIQSQKDTALPNFQISI